MMAVDKLSVIKATRGLDTADISHPQSLNHYAYLRNNPLNNTDPLGLDGCDLSELTCWLTFYGDADTSWWDSMLSWLGGPFNADPMAGSGGFDPLWNLSYQPPNSVVTSGPAAGLNPATGESTSDIDIRADIAANARALAPAMNRGAAIANDFAVAEGVLAGSWVRSPNSDEIRLREFCKLYLAQKFRCDVDAVIKAAGEEARKQQAEEDRRHEQERQAREQAAEAIRQSQAMDNMIRAAEAGYYNRPAAPVVRGDLEW
jgi:hypothetical protein